MMNMKGKNISNLIVIHVQECQIDLHHVYMFMMSLE